MATLFPGALDVLLNPQPTDKTNVFPHAALHTDENDAIEAVQAKVGANSSAVQTSHDYKLSAVTGSDKAIGQSKAWPVGSVFIAVVSTNPATLLGFGTWSAFGAGRVLVGFDAGQTEFDAVEETGGAKTHTLTTGEMPAHTHVQDTHTHTLPVGATDDTAAPFDRADAGTNTGGANATTASGSTVATNQNTGGGGAHNNLQPYITVFFWKRTA